jgi:DUF1365 family protein
VLCMMGVDSSNADAQMTEFHRTYLVSCVSKKRVTEAPAKGFYVSPWFVAARRYVSATGDPWYILSAKYGLVAPAQILAPYDETLKKMKIAERRAWASQVTAQMDELLQPEQTIVVFAGLRYREFLMDHLKGRFAVEVPMEGLTIGRQLQWLNNEARL